jgi:hypothetical protein
VIGEKSLHPRLVSIISLLIILAPALTRAASSTPVRLPGGAELAAVDFDRHVASLFGRLGCNAGSCHGSFQGRGGLNLSLFGHDPAHDFQALTRDALGRRVDVLDPDRSLLLRKATGLVAHEGGQRFPPGSWEYQVIRAWIATGARRDPARPAAQQIELHPRELFFDRPGDSAPLAVVARFADGSEADVTPFCEIRTRDDTIATWTTAGQVHGLKPGDTAVVATYRGLLAAARVIVPTGRAVCIPEVPESESDIVDRAINDKLRALGLEPSAPASDAEFLRRVTLDVTGSLPAPADVCAFLADSSPDKRSRKIDELLDHPRHAALWATRYLDITGCEVAALEGPPELRSGRARMWHDWFRKRFAENMPYDRIARDVLCATSRDGTDVRTWLERESARLSAAQAGRTTDYAAKPSLDLFWRRFSGDSYFPVEQMAERAAAAFLGVRIECAQCHKHPFDRWTQTDYRSFANIFAMVQFGLSPEALAAAAELLEERRRSDPGGTLPPTPRLREVYTGAYPSRRLADPATGHPLAPRPLGGPELDAAEGDGDPRESLFAWLTTADNPYFARSFVNRVWAVYFGAGLVEPVDGFSVANPPSNPRLLDELAADFRAQGYNIRRLERIILNSRAYQRSSTPTEGNRDDHGNFARARPRPLMAEVLVDALNDALGVPGEFGLDAPPGARAIEIATNRVQSPDLARAFRIFGRPRRTAVCDCERPHEPAVPQTLFLMTDSGLLAKIKSGRLRGLLGSGRPDAEIVAELFLATLSRAPDGDECQAGLDHVRGRSDRDRQAALVDILWALINTREFILNH